jgi:dihydrofolate reductase
MGGAALIGSFLDPGEIDEFLIAVMPTFIGEGIPLVPPRHRNVSLTSVGSVPRRGARCVPTEPPDSDGTAH